MAQAPKLQRQQEVGQQQLSSRAEKPERDRSLGRALAQQRGRSEASHRQHRTTGHVPLGLETAGHCPRPCRRQAATVLSHTWRQAATVLGHAWRHFDFVSCYAWRHFDFVSCFGGDISTLSPVLVETFRLCLRLHDGSARTLMCRTDYVISLF